MNYLTIEEIHQQLRMDPSISTEDDQLLTGIGDGAENFLENHLDRALDDIAAENGGELPSALKQALLLMVDYLYDNSGSGENREIPNSFWILVTPWKKYTIV